ncbi:hypothetical protein AB0I28_31985 [Phytomonospora sp. NPDC050363]|uniref:hypothetical protein n=1 Tax=Phytomonospora sp. NPDC050363 TaxID=3155642 RepID=UPI00340EACA1
MDTFDDFARARQLVQQTGHVYRVRGPGRWGPLLQWVSCGRWGRTDPWRTWEVPPGWPWQDTPSGNRTGWRQRAALTADGADHAFAVDYACCRPCGLAWVEEPYTQPAYQRQGLAGAGLAALRAEHPGLAWHTLGGHLSGARAFWDSAGDGVEGGYRPRALCVHVERGR